MAQTVSQPAVYANGLKKPEGDVWEWEVHWKLFWCWWCSWPDNFPLCTLCYVTFATLLGVTCFWPASMPSCMSPRIIPTPPITCNSPSPFQSPCFLSIIRLYRTHSCHVLCCVWSERRLQGCHQLMHSTSNIAVFHCHFNTPAPFWPSVLLPLCQYVASRFLYCLFFMDWLHFTVKATWSSEMSGAKHLRMQCHLTHWHTTFYNTWRTYKY